jgi:predicted nuclease of predicted toxin-antitoxin system
MNVPRSLGRRLEAVGHECRHLGEIGLSRASDAAVVREAAAHGETILTHDLDYANLLAFSGAAGPSVIIFRTRRTDSGHLFARLAGAWPAIDRPLRDGAIVVLEDAATRTRPLPIASRAGKPGGGGSPGRSRKARRSRRHG